MAARHIVALVACPLALVLFGCGGGGDGDTTGAPVPSPLTPTPSPTPSPPTPTPPDPTIRILEWVASNDVPLYRSKTRALIAPTQAEEGNLQFDMYEDTDPDDNQTRIWQYLVFKDKPAHTFHLETDVVKTWIKEVIDPGTLTTPNTSALVFMKSVKPNDLPVECVTEKPGLYVISAISSEGEAAELKSAALEFINPFRATAGVFYYDLLTPVTASERTFGDVAEIMWLRDETVLTTLRSSGIWTNMTSQFGSDLEVKETRPITYTELPLCGQAVALV